MARREIKLWPGEELVIRAGVVDGRSLDQVLEEIVAAGHVDIRLARYGTDAVLWSCSSHRDDTTAPDIKQDYAGWTAVAQPADAIGDTAVTAAEKCLRVVRQQEAGS